MAALDLPYEEFVRLNGGSENCGNLACGAPPRPNRRNDRDHDHLTGKPRGILCPPCNGFLTDYVGKSRRPVTAAFLRGLADYLDRAAAA